MPAFVIDGDGELAAVEVQVLRRKVVHVSEGHEVLEERIPSGRIVHATSQVRIALSIEPAMQRRHRPIEHDTHPPTGQECPTQNGTDVVHDVERPRRRVEQSSVGAAAPSGEPTEQPHQRQQRTHNQIPEEHVEQQLSVRPARAIRPPPQVLLARLIEEPVEDRARLIHLNMNRVLVHLSQYPPQWLTQHDPVSKF